MKPSVLCICDVPGWAFDRNCRDMAAALADDFDFRFWYMQNGPPPREGYDAYYCAYRWDLRIPMGHAIGSLRCEVFDATAPGPPTDFQCAEVNRFRAFHTVTRGAFDQLRRRCPQVQYLTNPVDTTRFMEPPGLRGGVVASWTGHAKHPHPAGLDLKGFETIVLPACDRARVPLVYAERVTRPVAADRMSAFYGRGNVTLCASIVEGASNSVMEAMAAGHTLISTACGNVAEMQASQQKHLGATGIVIVPRSVEAFADALGSLTAARVAEMGALNAWEIRDRWSWRAWAPKYETLIRSVLC